MPVAVVQITRGVVIAWPPSVKSQGPGLSLFQAALALVPIDSLLHCRSFARHQLKTQSSPPHFQPSNRYPRQTGTQSQPFARDKRDSLKIVQIETPTCSPSANLYVPISSSRYPARHVLVRSILLL